MRTPCTLLRLGLVLVLLLFGMPAGAAAVDVTDTPPDSAGAAAERIWISSGLEAPAAPKTRTSNKAPEGFAVAITAGSMAVGGLRPELVPAPDVAAPGIPTPLYLSHCVFLC